jgi:hypothetical protein
VNLGFGGDDIAQQRLGPFNMDGKIIVDKKTAVWPLSLRARAFNKSSSLTTLSLVRKRMESPKNPVTVQNSQP